MNNRKKKTSVSRIRVDRTLGVLAGIVFSLFAWGIDGYLLQQNNASLPWLKTAICTPAAILILTLAVLLSSRFNNLLIRAIIWIAIATVLSLLISGITFKGSELALKLIYPNVASEINYVVPESIRGRLFVILVMSIILFMIGGLLIESARDAMIKASGAISWLIPVIFYLAFFGGAGYVADANFNFHLRNQIIAVNSQIQNSAQINMATITEKQQRLIRRFTKLNVELDKPRRLLISSFDESFTQSTVLINFDGIWTRCTSVSGIVGNCERINTELP